MSEKKSFPDRCREQAAKDIKRVNQKKRDPIRAAAEEAEKKSREKISGYLQGLINTGKNKDVEWWKVTYEIKIAAIEQAIRDEVEKALLRELIPIRNTLDDILGGSDGEG